MPVWDKPEPYFEVLDKLKRVVPPRKNPWRIAPDDKRIPTHKMARTRKCLVAIHPNAIAIGSPTGSEPRGLLGWFGLTSSLIFSAIILFFSLILLVVSFLIFIWQFCVCFFSLFFCSVRFGFITLR